MRETWIDTHIVMFAPKHDSSVSYASTFLPYYSFLQELLNQPADISQHQVVMVDTTAVSDIRPLVCGNTGKRKSYAYALPIVNG